MDVITLGTFDLLHTGHIKLFKKCREISGRGKVMIGLNTDEFIEKYKGRSPVMTYSERSEMIWVTDLIDHIIPNDQSSGSAKEVIEKSGAKLIVIGSDWARKDYVGQLGLDWDWLDDKEIGICYVNYTKGISTTEIKRRMSDQPNHTNTKNR